MLTIKLRNGADVPTIVFGPDELGYSTRRKRSNNKLVRAIKKIKRKTFDEWEYINQVPNGIKAGFHSIDFSAAYGDGTLISKAIRKSGIARTDMFLITRVSYKAQFSGGYY